MNARMRLFSCINLKSKAKSLLVFGFLCVTLSSQSEAQILGTQKSEQSSIELSPLQVSRIGYSFSLGTASAQGNNGLGYSASLQWRHYLGKRWRLRVSFDADTGAFRAPTGMSLSATSEARSQGFAGLGFRFGGWLLVEAFGGVRRKAFGLLVDSGTVSFQDVWVGALGAGAEIKLIGSKRYRLIYRADFLSTLPTTTASATYELGLGAIQELRQEFHFSKGALVLGVGLMTEMQNYSTVNVQGAVSRISLGWRFRYGPQK